MKKKYLILLTALFFCIRGLHAKDFEVEVRTGISYSPDLMGLNAGVFASSPLTNNVFLQSGLLLHTVGAETYTYRGIGINLPVYASWRYPIDENTKLRVNVGPYVGVADNWNFGVTAETGVDLKNFFLGLSYFQNCITDKKPQLNLSIGYKFGF